MCVLFMIKDQGFFLVIVKNKSKLNVNDKSINKQTKPKPNKKKKTREKKFWTGNNWRWPNILAWLVNKKKFSKKQKRTLEIGNKLQGYIFSILSSLALSIHINEEKKNIIGWSKFIKHFFFVDFFFLKITRYRMLYRYFY